MDLAYAAGRSGGTMTGVLSAANEQVQLSVRREACAAPVSCQSRCLRSSDDEVPRCNPACQMT